MAEIHKNMSISSLPYLVLIEILKKTNLKEFFSVIKTCRNVYSVALSSRIPLRIPMEKELIIMAIRYQHPTFHLVVEPDVKRLLGDIVPTLRMFKFKKVTLVVEQSPYYKQRVVEIKRVLPLREYKEELTLHLKETTSEMLEIVKDIRPNACRVTFNESLTKEEMTRMIANSPLSFCEHWEVTNPGFLWTFKEIVGTRETFAINLTISKELWKCCRQLRDEWLFGATVNTKRVKLTTFDLNDLRIKGPEPEIVEEEFPGKEFFEEFDWRKGYSIVTPRAFPKGLLIVTRVHWDRLNCTEIMYQPVDSVESFHDAFYFILSRLRRNSDKLKEEKWKDILTKTFEYHWKKTENGVDAE